VLIRQEDIGSARIVLERAAETGNALANFVETYDPLILPKWGTYGTRGDAKARESPTLRRKQEESARQTDRLYPLDR
jgi:hypothetical protein